MIARLFSRRYPNGPTDHLMTKTTYLDDPEGNTIEIYADTPDDGTLLRDPSQIRMLISIDPKQAR